MTVRAPQDTHRTLVLGRTGTGKSQASLDMLSSQNWDEMPWVIIDYKGEDLIADIRKQNKGRIKEIKLEDKPPRAPGLYYMHPRPKLDDAAMEAWLFKVHKQGNVGLFIDEGYAMPNYGDSPAFTMILTQGRSLHIPVICLYQRPVWMSRFAVAQADFIRVFKQGDIRDVKTVNNYCGSAILPSGEKLGPMQLNLLPDYYSLWHDVGRGQTAILLPAPGKRDILAKFKRRLQPQAQGYLV